jgi:hypothetical protein
MRCPGWCWDGGVGHTGPMATKATGPAGLTSQHSPGQAWSRRPSFFEGATRRPYESGRHSVAGLIPVTPHSVAQWRGGLAGGVAEQRRVVIPRRVVARIRL